MSSYRSFTHNDHRGSLQTISVSGYLANFVEFFWQSDFNYNGEEYIYSHALPNFSSLISFNLNQLSWQSVELPGMRSYTFKQSKIFGSIENPCLCKYPQGLKQAGIKLKPGALSLLLGISATELYGFKENLNTFFDICNLEEQLQNSDTFLQRAQLMEGFIAGHLPVSFDYRYSFVQEAISRFDVFLPYGNAIRQIADDLCVTPKSLTRYFQQFIGFSPKWCLKVHRFTKTLSAYQQQSNHLAYEQYGYNDHSHLYKDSIALAGRPISLL